MHNYVKSAGLAERLSIEEAARLVVKETGKSWDYAISLLIDFARDGHFSAEIVAPSDRANVSHLSNVDPTKSTISTAELVKWLDDCLEDAHAKARAAMVAKESEKWGYAVKPEDGKVHLLPLSEQLDDLSRDETISMSTRNWVEYLADDVVERQQWSGAERDAKRPVLCMEYLNIFGQLSATLPLRQELSGLRWAGNALPRDWLTRFHISKTDLRNWARTHAPEIANSRVLGTAEIAFVNDAAGGIFTVEGGPTGDAASRVAWRLAIKNQWPRMLQAHGQKYPGPKKALAWFKANDQEGTFKPPTQNEIDDKFTWVGSDGSVHKTSLKTFQNAISEMQLPT